MNIFNRTEDEILFDLIAKDNPTLNPPLTADNCYIGPANPNTEADSGAYNTIATVIPRYGSGLHGRTTIKYNRIDLGDLFRNQQPVKVVGKSANAFYATQAEIPIFFGSTYSLPIQEGDVDPGSSSQFYTDSSGQYGTSVFKVANNKCFIGQVYVGFNYDITDSLATYFTSGKLATIMTLPEGVGNESGHPNWPFTIGYFADVDFSEIKWTVDHDNDISLAQANAIGLFMGRTYVAPATGTFNPVIDYDQDNPYGCYEVWNKHVVRGYTSSWVGTFPWLDTRYSHFKMTRMRFNPATGGMVGNTHYFVFYYNSYETEFTAMKTN